MTNPKIEKVNAAIAKTKNVIAAHQSKLRELERQKIKLEDDEIVAMFRREKLNEDEFAKLLRANAKNNHAREDTQTTAHDEAPKKRKEENPGDFA